MVSVIINGMRSALSIDPAGRVVLPHEVRERFHLRRGAKLALEVRPDAIILRPEVARPSLVEEGGLLVHEGRAVGDLTASLEGVRRQRDLQVSGFSG